MMKSIQGWAVLAALALASAGSAWAAAEAASEGTKTTVTGRLACTWCNLAHPKANPDRKCCVRCIRAGDPPLLTSGDGQQYILLTGTHETPLMTPARYELVGSTVKVEGLLVKGQGVQAIKVKSMAKVEVPAEKESLPAQVPAAK